MNLSHAALTRVGDVEAESEGSVAAVQLVMSGQEGASSKKHCFYLNYEFIIDFISKD